MSAIPIPTDTFIAHVACFSPTVPSYIRKLWVKNGGTLTHNEDDFRKANFFFCDGMEDPWLNELLSRSLIVRHAAWVTLCVVEDFIMPIADYTLDAGFDESKICILEPGLPAAASATASAVGISGIQVQKNSSLPPKKAAEICPAPAPAPIPPFDVIQLVNQRKRRRDDEQNEDEEQEEEAQERQRPRKKARRELERYNWNLPQPLARRRELPLAFSTVRGAQMMMAVEVEPRAIQTTSEGRERRVKEGKGKEKEKGNWTEKTDDVQGGNQASNQVGVRVQSQSVDTSKGFGTAKFRGSKAKRAFEKCIVRSENGAARPLPPPPPPVPGPPIDGNAPLALHSAHHDPTRERGERSLTTGPTITTTKMNTNAHTLFWNDILAKSFPKDGTTAPCLHLSVGDLLQAPRTKAVIFDVNKSYLGRRFIYLDNQKEE